MKILILGSCGSGKTWLSTLLSEGLNIPLINLDKYYLNIGWKEKTIEEKRKITYSLCKGSDWVMDGNYASTLDIRVKYANIAVLLDTNRYLCLFRTLKRTLYHFSRERPELKESQCYERLDFNLIKYILTYPKHHRTKILNMIYKHPDKVFYRIKNENEKNKLIKILLS